MGPMGDIRCAKCGEPWDAFGVRNGDMEFSDAARFLNGEGCPTCNFGQGCPACDGTGKLQEWHTTQFCDVCRGFRLVTVRRLVFLHDGRGATGPKAEWRYGWDPNTKPMPTDQEPNITRRKTFGCLEGTAEEGRVTCWACAPPPCDVCHGTGKFQETEESRRNTERFQTLRELSGDDVDGLLNDLEDLG